MKYLLVTFILFVILFNACSKKEEVKLTVYNATAFAYDLGNSWEVDATTRVKGFMQKEDKGMFSASLAYEINLITPKKDTIKSLISKVVDKSEKEKMSDTNLEAQFDLDSTYSDGTYKLIWKVKDVFTSDTASSSSNFKLESE